MSILSIQCQEHLADAIRQMLSEVSAPVDGAHIERTPERVVKAYMDLLSGVAEDPAEVLRLSFEESAYNEMIVVENIDFVSVCFHHLLPFYGVCHFAYLPDKRIVGLSKIPRMVDILSRRPQVQEKL